MKEIIKYTIKRMYKPIITIGYIITVILLGYLIASITRNTFKYELYASLLACFFSYRDFYGLRRSFVYLVVK